MNSYTLFTRQIGLVGITYILTSVSTFILLPILTNNLSIQEYGIWVQINVTVLLLSNLSLIGFPSAMTRFLASQQDKEVIQEGFYSITIVVFILGIITSSMLLLFSNQLADLLFNGNLVVAMLLPGLVLISCINNLFLTYFRTFQKIKKYSVFVILQAYLNVFIISVFVLLNQNVISAMIGLLITQILLFIIMIIIILFEINFKFPKFIHIKEYLSFSLPTIPSTLSSWIVDSSDRYIIGIMLSTTFVGYYSPSYTLAMVVSMILIPFSTMLPPVLSKHYDEKRNDIVKTIFNYSLKYYLILAIPAVFGLSLLSKPILMVLTTPEIASNGYLVTPFVTLGALIYGIYGIYIIVLLLKMKTKIIGSVWIIAAIFNIVLNILLVPTFGILAAATVTLVTYIITFVIVYFYSNNFFKIGFDYRIVTKILVSSIFMSIFIILINPNGILELSFVIIASILIYTTMILLTSVIKKEEIKFLVDTLRRN